ADMPFIESLKLRASYGLAGNDEIGNYSAKTYYTSQNFLGRFGLVRGNIGNPELKWETNTRFNTGIDAAFLKERLSLSVDFYRNQICDVTIYDPVYTSTGFRYAVTYCGGMRNAGVELAVNVRLHLRERQKYNM